MFRKRSLGLALLLSAAIGILILGSVHATAIATSQISFSSLQIIPDPGTVVYLGGVKRDILNLLRCPFDFRGRKPECPLSILRMVGAGAAEGAMDALQFSRRK